MGDFLAAMGPGIANHLWQSTAFAAAAWLVTLALGRNQARVRHAVWVAASVKFLVPFSLLIAAGNLLPHPKQAVAPVVYSAMDVVEEPFTEVAAAEVPTYAAMKPRHEWGTQMLPVSVGVLWVAGVGMVVAVWGLQWRKVRRTLREAEVVSGGREWEILRRLEAGLEAQGKANHREHGGEERTRSGAGATTGILRCAQNDNTEGGIELRLSKERMEPGIFGIVRPALVWPGELSARLDDAQIEAVLAHELMHVRRRDNLTAALHMLVEMVFWFHPVVWWMERQMVKEREQACDEAVVAMGGDAETYAESLLKTCRFCVESPLVCVAGVTGGELKRRVLEIAMGRALVRMSWVKKLLLAGAAVCVVVAPVMLGQAKAAERMMLAAIKAAPKPVREMIAEIATPAVGEIAEAQVGTQPSVVAPAAASGLDDLAVGPAFEVATVRPGDRSDGRRRFGTWVDDSGHFVASAQSLASLVQRGYGSVDLDRAAPKWVESEDFDVNAKVDDAYMAGWDKMSDAQRIGLVRPMVRRLLVDRFKLKLRSEMRDIPVYTLVQAKGGAKMKEVPPPPPPEGSTVPGIIINCPGKEKEVTCMGKAVPMSQLIGLFMGFGNLQVGRTVIDETGLKAYYDYSFTVSSDADADPPMKQIEDQLGLRFEPTKAPRKIYVIESAEKPTVDGAEVAMPAQQAPKTSVDPATPVSLPQFDAATIKHPDPNARGGRSGFYGSPGGRIFFGGPARMLVQYAYGLQDYQLTGGPEWIAAEGLGPNWLEINAVPPADSASRKITVGNAEPTAEQRLMLQSLLRDRFGLKFHFEAKEGEVYILTRGTKPLQLKPTNYPNTDPRAVVFGTLGAIAQRPNGGGTTGAPAHSFTPISLPDGGIALQGTNTTADYLALRMSRYLQLPVLNQTGIEGSYDFDVPVADPESQDTAAQVLELADDLGLKIKRGRGPVQTLVIDHIERPSEN